MSREYPTCSTEVVVGDKTYLVDYDQEVIQIESVECKIHRLPAIVSTTSTIYEIRDENALPLPDSTNIEELETKIRKALRDGEPQCEECLESDS